MSHSEAKPKPSSTVVIMREAESQLEVLLVKRNTQLKTNGGAWVFPGGAIDSADQTSIEDDILTAMNAAKREALEETNIDLSASRFESYSHWVTPVGIPRRYATWFFLSKVPFDTPVTVDGSEIVDYHWLTPKKILTQHREGKLQLTPPTFVTLSELHCCDTPDAALQFAASRNPPTYRPKLAQSGPIRIILYEDDVAYGDCDLTSDGKYHRLVMNGNDWQYQRL
ncbi:NUDIX hydrolase [Aurantivibrio plasticivorans]